MPTYEYACKKCGEHLEVVQSFKDEPLTKCPNCRGALRKVFGNVGIVFKGSGFYKTDSRPAAKSEAKTDAGSTSTDTPKSEPAKATDTKKADTKSTDTKPASASKSKTAAAS